MSMIIANAKVGDPVESVGGPPLIVAKSDAEGIVATGDGGPYVSKWHQGTRSKADDVYVERHNFAGLRVFHGWIDADSRKLVQTG